MDLGADEWTTFWRITLHYSNLAFSLPPCSLFPGHSMTCHYVLCRWVGSSTLPPAHLLDDPDVRDHACPDQSPATSCRGHLEQVDGRRQGRKGRRDARRIIE